MIYLLVKMATVSARNYENAGLGHRNYECI